VIITDAAGRQWRVHDFQILAGKSSRLPLGRGQRRGFEPLDGGARRSLLLTEADRARGISEAVLLEQLAAAPLYFRDDPARSFGRPPERVDPPSR